MGIFKLPNLFVLFLQRLEFVFLTNMQNKHVWFEADWQEAKRSFGGCSTPSDLIPNLCCALTNEVSVLSAKLH